MTNIYSSIATVFICRNNITRVAIPITKRNIAQRLVICGVLSGNGLSGYGFLRCYCVTYSSSTCCKNQRNQNKLFHNFII